jgi:hypothetical protein
MNEELKSKLLEILTAAQKAGADAYDYALREAPELAREVVLWNVVEYAVSLACGLVLLGFAVWLWRQIKLNWDTWEVKFDGRQVAYPVMLSFALIAGGIAVATCSTQLIKAKVAPRVFFIMSCKELLTR